MLFAQAAVLLALCVRGNVAVGEDLRIDGFASVLLALCVRGNVAVGEDLLRIDGFVTLAQILRRKGELLSGAV
ncbi:hypothetical protein T484DRAFT_1831637 [Baffinella frigidus]|nr:hypothetical protein T484DRAFT_1831637 [Cryptophyta sp. CCMP2293]